MCVPDILVTDTFLAVKQQMHDLQMCVPDILVTHAFYRREADPGKKMRTHTLLSIRDTLL